VSFAVQFSSREYAGNGSTSTPYPIAWPYDATEDIYVSVLAQGTGTVAVVAGDVTFSSAQPSLNVGSKVRIASTIYEIDTRESDFLFTFTTRPTIASTTFHLPDSATILSGAQFTPVEVGAGAPYVTTAVAYPATTIVRVFRALDLTQPYHFTEGDTLPVVELMRALDRLAMLIQQVRAEAGLDGATIKIPGNVTNVNGVAIFTDAAARADALPAYIGQPGVQLDTGTLWRGNSFTAGDWVQLTGGTVPLGGTGLATLTAYAILCGGVTATGAMQQVSGLGTAGQVLRSNGPGALPTWQTLSVGGDVVGPAFAQANSIPVFSGTTGKLLKAGLGTNDGTSAHLSLGTITDTTARAFTVFQVWNNAALTGRLLTLAVEANAAAATSTFINFDDDGTNMGEFMLTGEWRLLDGGPTYPAYSFLDEPGTGMYRDATTGGVFHAVAGAIILKTMAPGVQVMTNFTVTVSAVDKLSVTSTFVKAFVDFLPGTDNARDLGSGALRWRNIYFNGTLTGGAVAATTVTFTLQATSNAAPTIASAGTIAPVKAITFISGTAAISTITPPSPISAGGGQITLIPTGLWTTDTAGNIALASTAVVSRALIMTYDATTTKWYPSY